MGKLCQTPPETPPGTPPNTPSETETHQTQHKRRHQRHHQTHYQRHHQRYHQRHHQRQRLGEIKCPMLWLSAGSLVWLTWAAGRQHHQEQDQVGGGSLARAYSHVSGPARSGGAADVPLTRDIIEPGDQLPAKPPPRHLPHWGGRQSSNGK